LKLSQNGLADFFIDDCIAVASGISVAIAAINVKFLGRYSLFVTPITIMTLERKKQKQTPPRNSRRRCFGFWQSNHRKQESMVKIVIP